MQPSATRKRRPWYRSKWVNLAIGSVVTVLCLWWAVRLMAEGRPMGEFLRDLRDRFRQANYVTVLPIWFVLFIFYWIKAWRWRLLLLPVAEYRTSTLFPPVMIGFAFNNVLPAHLGDLVRIIVFARQKGEPLTAVFTSVALERVLDAMAILALLGLGLGLMPQMADPGVRQSMLIAAAGICVALIGSAVYLIWTGPFVAAFEWIVSRAPLFPDGLRRKLVQMLEQGARGLSSLKHGHLLAGVTLSSLVQWSLNALVIHLSLWSFGIHVSPLVSCIVMGMTAFGVTVPATPGYFGVIQVCFSLVLRYFTDADAAVVAASIYYQLVQWVPVTAVGLAFFWQTGLRMAEVTEQAEEAAQSPGISPSR